LSSLATSESPGRLSFFVPLFQALSYGGAKAKSIAAAIAGLGFLYEKKDNEWTIIKPACPTIYGIPTEWMIARNYVMDRSSEVDKVHLSDDGAYAFQLHSYVPKPAQLTYIPYVMHGGHSVLVPLRLDIVSNILPEVVKSLGNEPDNYTNYYVRILNKIVPLPDKLDSYFDPNTKWSGIVASFPHLFFCDMGTKDERFIMNDVILKLKEGNTSRPRIQFASDPMSAYGTLLLSFYDAIEIYDTEDWFKASILDSRAGIDEFHPRSAISVKPAAPSSSGGSGGDSIDTTDPQSIKSTDTSQGEQGQAENLNLNPGSALESGAEVSAAYRDALTGDERPDDDATESDPLAGSMESRASDPEMPDDLSSQDAASETPEDLDPEEEGISEEEKKKRIEAKKKKKKTKSNNSDSEKDESAASESNSQD
jgi:hypothetical protein